VAPVLRNVERHHHEVRHAYVDLFQAPGAEVGLARLERVDERDFEVLVVVVAYRRFAAHASSSTQTRTHATIIR